MHMLTQKLSPEQQERLLEHLSQRPYERTSIPHARAAARREGLTLVLYESGKLVAQGKGLRDWVEFVFEPDILHSTGILDGAPPPDADFSPHIGIDESGKGDFFGPMVIAAFRVTPDMATLFQELGVRDSKAITSDTRIATIARRLREAHPDACEGIVLAPAKYNELVKRMGSVNRVLAWAHATVLENLLAKFPDTPMALADQFGAEHLIRNALKTRGKGVELRQMHKAESDPAVAAASILAREAFVRTLHTLGAEVGAELPKGATHVRAPAEELVRRLGPDVLKTTAKTHFKTTRQVLSACGHDPALLGTPEPRESPWKHRTSHGS